MTNFADTCVIYNPRAGRGKLSGKIDQLRQLWAGARFLPTSGPGDAIQLTKQAIEDGFLLIVAAGGDGTIHEVANGLLTAANHDAVLGVIPLGSANDFAFALDLNHDWWRNDVDFSHIRKVDVGKISDGEGREEYFVNCLGIGFNCAVTTEARKIRWLRGLPLYGLALFRAMMKHFSPTEMDLVFDEHIVSCRTLALSIAIGPREGNFIIAPNAKLDDGLFDYLHVEDISRLKLLRYSPRLIKGNLPENDGQLHIGRCATIDVKSKQPLAIHADGEFFCQSGDRISEVTVTLLPSALKVLNP